MRRVSIPARDLRILDPTLSYPSTVLGREKAIVVNLEHIKCIITAQEVLLLNWQLPAVAALVDELRRRLPSHFNALGEQATEMSACQDTVRCMGKVAGDGGGGLSDNEGSPKSLVLDRSPEPGMRFRGEGAVTAGSRRHPGAAASGWSASEVDDDGKVSMAVRGGPMALPFEFRALEACLEAACTFLDTEASALEKEAYPALDELTSAISTLNLERVRQLKSRLVAISSRVQKVRDEVEQLLDDDEDMDEMYLTDKLHRELERTPSRSLSPSRYGQATPAFEPAVTPLQTGPSLTESEAGLSKEDDGNDAIDDSGDEDHGEGRRVEDGLDQEGMDENEQQQRLRRMRMRGSGGRRAALPPRPPRGEADLRGSQGVSAVEEGSESPGSHRSHGSKSSRGSSSSSSSSNSTSQKSLDVEELEMLLEAYFVQIEGTLNKLSTLREYVDDTQDYIEIMLDDKQNHLLQMNVLLTTATLVITMFVVITGIFGMNIHISLFDDKPSNYNVFYYVCFGSATGAVCIFLAVVWYCKYKRLIE
eukprot:SM000029S10531  [mRNA]  locus=s29:647963:650499:- [translate_table: standard]